MKSQEKTLLGIDLGSSSVKVSLLDFSGRQLAESSYPDAEMAIDSPQPGWAEQDPEVWYANVIEALKRLRATCGSMDSVQSIGISYQMHGLVLVDEAGNVLRPAIIWCDGRAVEQGKQTANTLGEAFCLEHLLNLPGNFTASKLRWVKENEPAVYERIKWILLPGDYLAYRLSGKAATTVSGLSEGTFYDVGSGGISEELLSAAGLRKELIPERVPTFGIQGTLQPDQAGETGLPAGIPIAYRAGDQPNNALSLKAMEDGEFAATAGTSGVIYGVTAKPLTDPLSRVNTFVHVNHRKDDPRYGVLLCINGTGIMNSWLKKQLGTHMTYQEMNRLAETAPAGCDGLLLLPFGNGPERIFENRTPGASLHHLDLNRHGTSHLCRAVQEGIVFALAYGLELMQEMGMNAGVIRAGHANMFLSETFARIFVNTTGIPLELYNTNGAAGAALGGAMGAGLLTREVAFTGLTLRQRIDPDQTQEKVYREIFKNWKALLHHQTF